MVNSKGTKILGELKKIPRERLILGGIIIVVIIIVVVVISMATKPPPPPEEAEEPELIYEIVVGDIKFKLKEVKDRGSVLEVSESIYPESSSLKDLVTTERFIEVTIGAENQGKDNIRAGEWDVRELIDSEDRKFYSIREAKFWILKENKCGHQLKPGFSPTFCTKIYEVARISTGLKAEVYYKKKGSDFVDLGL